MFHVDHVLLHANKSEVPSSRGSRQTSRDSVDVDEEDDSMSCLSELSERDLSL